MSMTNIYQNYYKYLDNINIYDSDIISIIMNHNLSNHGVDQAFYIIASSYRLNNDNTIIENFDKYKSSCLVWDHFKDMLIYQKLSGETNYLVNYIDENIYDISDNIIKDIYGKYKGYYDWKQISLGDDIVSHLNQIYDGRIDIQDIIRNFISYKFGF